MNYQLITTLFIIFIWLLGLAFFTGLVLLVYHYGRRSVKNNPEKGLIFVQNGDKLNQPIKTDLKILSNGGSGFLYKKHTVIVPANYKETYFNGKRVIYLSHTGQVIASPFQNDVLPSDSEKFDLIYNIIESNVGSSVMKEIKGKSSNSAIIIIVVAFLIGAGLVFGYFQYQNTAKLQQTKQQQQQQQIHQPEKQPIPDDIIVK